MFDVIAIGSATQDMFLHVPGSKVIRLQSEDAEDAYLALDYGAKIEADEVFITTGGGATNVAVTFARMGLRTAALCKVGRDNLAQRVREELEADGADTSLFVYDEKDHTGLSVIITTFTGDRTIVAHRGAGTELREDELPWEEIGQAQWVYLGAMAGASAALWTPIARFCGDRGVKLAINPGRTQTAQGIGGLAEVYGRTSAVFVNQQEARQITGVAQERGPGDEVQMLRVLHEAGCERVFITDGADGVWGSEDGRCCRVGSYRVPVVSTVGAGDAFAAGCVAALMKGADLCGAMRLGSANAAHVVQHMGAKEGVMSWAEAQAFVKDRAAAGEQQVEWLRRAPVSHMTRAQRAQEGK